MAAIGQEQINNYRQMAAPLPTLTGMNALEMDSEGRIVEVVLGTEFLTIAPLATLTGINALEMDSEGWIVEVLLAYGVSDYDR